MSPPFCSAHESSRLGTAACADAGDSLRQGTSATDYKDADAFKDHTNNKSVKKFNEIMDGVIAGWTMVIPFGESFTSNLDE